MRRPCAITLLVQEGSPRAVAEDPQHLLPRACGHRCGAELCCHRRPDMATGTRRRWVRWPAHEQGRALARLVTVRSAGLPGPWRLLVCTTIRPSSSRSVGVWAFLGVLQYLARFGVHADFLRDAAALDVERIPKPFRTVATTWPCETVSLSRTGTDST
jgi:hypothetical protein